MERFYKHYFLLALFIGGIAFFVSPVSFGQTASKLDELKSELNQTSNDSLKVALRLKISRQMDRQNYSKEETYAVASEAIEEAINQNNTSLQAQALDNLGLLYRFHANYMDAADLHIEAYELVKDQAVNPVNKMIYANNAGVALRNSQQYADAVYYYMLALELAEEEQNLKNIAIASNGIGISLGQIPSRREESIIYFEKSLAVEKILENSLGIAMNYLSIGHYYIDKGEYATARDYFNELLKINQEREDVNGLAITNKFYGLSYLEEGKQLEKAYAYMEKALAGFQSLKNEPNQAGIIALLGEIREKQGNIAQAEVLYKEALTIAERAKHLSLLQDITHNLYRIKEERNQFEEALNYYKLSQSYKDSIRLDNQNLTIEVLTRKYDLSKKEKQIALLEKDKELQQAQIEGKDNALKSRMKSIVLLLTGLVMVLTIFFFQYRNTQLKKKSTELLIEKEKEKINAEYERNLALKEATVSRLRINPHFLFNSLNAINYLIQSNQNMEAIKYLKIFSRYTRMVLETSQNNVIPIREELKLANYYLTLEKNRFDKLFSYNIIGADHMLVNELNIPPLLLQPFLENAIWHGLLPSTKESLEVTIRIEESDNGLDILIDDNGIGRQAAKEKQKRNYHRSMGISIINQRIDLFNNSFEDKIQYQTIDKMKGEEAMGTQIRIHIESKKSFSRQKTGT